MPYHSNSPPIISVISASPQGEPLISYIFSNTTKMTDLMGIFIFSIFHKFLAPNYDRFKPEIKSGYMTG